MTTTEIRYNELLTQISRMILPTGVTARFWINKCPREELLQLGAKLGKLCDKMPYADGIFLVAVDEYKNDLGQDIEITLWM